MTSLAKDLNKAYENRWKEETAKGIAKILINWAKYAGLIEQRSGKTFNSKKLWLFKKI